MTNIRDLLDETSVPEERLEAIEKEISEKIKKMILEDKILQGTEWKAGYDFISHRSFKVFGDYDVQGEIIAALAEFGSIKIYEHKPWEGGYPKISTLERRAWMDGDIYPIINLPSFAKKKEIKELIDATGIVLNMDSLDNDIAKAKKLYDWAIEVKEKWEV